MAVPRLRLTPQARAEIFALIRQFLATAKSGPKLAAQLNKRLRLKLLPKTYERMAVVAGLSWPRRKIHRFTPEQSEQLNRRRFSRGPTHDSRERPRMEKGYCWSDKRGTRKGTRMWMR